MGLVRPFRGLRFSSSAGDMSHLMAPPYDVIDDDFRKELYARSPYNIVRISKSAEIANESEDDQYKHAAQEWEKWREQKVTIRDEELSYYLYEEEFSVSGETYKRLGLICAHELVPFGKEVLPHEKTLSGPKVDRLRLLKQTQTHFGQIFGLYADDDGGVDKRLRELFQSAEELYEGKDDDGVIHRVRRVFNENDVKEVTGLFEGKAMIIADGHHRYETALGYSKEVGTPQASCLMMTAVSLANPGLLILPTHRLVKNLDSWDAEKLMSSLDSQFEVHRVDQKQQALDQMADLFKQGKSAVTLYSDKKFTVLVKKDGVVPNVEGSDTYKALDVVTLHKLILEDHLGIDQEKLAKESNVEYIKDSGDAIDRSIALVDSGSHQAVFLMNTTPLDQTKAIAENGELMPQKSTFFHPKVFTGLVTLRIEPGVIEGA
jgi:uncharacterized protein (DUF1015 family)